MTQLYYTPPTDQQFDEVKEKAIELWSTIGSEPSYSQEKISRIRYIKNVSDNFMFMVVMFDIHNQLKLSEKLSQETNQAIHDRILDGGGRDGIFIQYI